MHIVNGKALQGHQTEVFVLKKKKSTVKDLSVRMFIRGLLIIPKMSGAY